MQKSNKFFLLLCGLFLISFFDSRVCLSAEFEAAESAVEEAAAAAARDMAEDLGITEAKDIETLQNTIGSAMKDFPEGALENPQVLKDVANAAKESLTGSLNAMKEAGENMAGALDKLGQDSEALAKMTSGMQDATEASITTLEKTGKITGDEAGKMLNALKEGQEADEALLAAKGTGSFPDELPESAKSTVTNPAAEPNTLDTQQEQLVDDIAGTKKGPGDAAESGPEVKEKTKLDKIKEFFTGPSSEEATANAEKAAQDAKLKAERPNASEATKAEAEKAEELAQKTRKVSDAEAKIQSATDEAASARSEANQATEDARNAAKEARENPENAELQEEAKAAQEKADTLNEKAAAKDAEVAKAKEELSAAKKDLAGKWDVKGKLLGAGHFIMEQVAMILFMTIPQMMQQAMEAELQRKAQLRTVASPIKFGNWVLQVIESCVNDENPLQSVPLYVLVPVENVGDAIAKDTSLAFDNTIAGGTQGAYNIKLLGVAGTDAAQRYNSGNPSYYNYGHFVMSYPSSSYDNIGNALITDPQFSGLIVDLHSGLAIDATGEQVTAPPSPPLIPMKANAPQFQQSNVKAISQSCASILEKLTQAGGTATYETFSGVNQGVQVSESVSDYFDCDQNTGQTLKKDTATTDAKGKSATALPTPCIIHEALDRYASGVTFGDFGSVIPLFGWGTTQYNQLINETTFPTYSAMSVGEATKEGVVVKNLGNALHPDASVDKGSKKAAKKLDVAFANPNNYVAQGCWIYLSADTPFAKAVQQGSQMNSATGSYVDYVIFFDENGNQVPLQAPSEQPVPGNDSVKWPTIGLNPKVKYMASLLSTDIAAFQHDGTAVAYDEHGQEVAIPDLSDKIKSAIDSLKTNFKSASSNLYAQFEEHSKALIGRYHSGPFVYGNNHLTEASAYNVTDGSSNIFFRVYEGMNCFGTSGQKAVQDILWARDNSGVVPPKGLPDSDISQLISLVTDIVYTVQKDGSLKASDDKAFQNAPGTWNGKIFTVDNSKESALTWLPYIYKQYTDAGAKIGEDSYKKLTDYVTAQREAWFKDFDDSALVQGIMVGNLHVKLASELDSQAAQAHSLWIYEISPIPSASFVTKDWFIAVDDAEPSLSTLKMINVAEKASEAKALVSLVTGTVYDMKGHILKDKSERNVMLSATATTKKKTVGQEIYQHLNTVYPVGKGMSQLFATTLKAAIDHFAMVENRPILVGSMGKIHLGIYAGDIATGNYVYFNASGLTSTLDFSPKDLFVTVEPGKPTIFGKMFDKDTTKFIMSLVSGQVYDLNGPKMKMSMSAVSNYASSHSVYWRSWLKDSLAQLQAAYIAQQAAEKKELDDLKKRAQVVDQNISWTQSAVVDIITRLQSSPLLPAPYAMLKQDSLEQFFVRLAPGSLTDSKEYTYTFFDVPNSYKGANDASVPVGAIFSSKGELLQEFKGSVLESFKHQFGLYGDTKKLGAPMMQPSLLMDKADTTLKPGASGTSMIVSTSSDFPGKTVKMGSGYYLYYSTIMNGYYVLDVKNKQWVGLAGGHIYGLDGQPVPLNQSVATNKSKKGDMRLLLLEENKAGYMQGMMMNPLSDNKYTEWTNLGTGTWKSSFGNVLVQETKSGKDTTASAYTMSFKKSKKDTATTDIKYSVNSDYQWQELIFLPINETSGEVLQEDKKPASGLLSARMVKVKGKFKFFILDGIIYQVTESNGNSYTVDALNKSADIKTVTLLVDKHTNVPYVKVVDGTGSKTDSSEYIYGYVYDSMNKDELLSFFTKVVKGAVTVCPISVPVGKKRTNIVFISNIANVNSMKPVDVKDVLGTPDQTSSVYQVFSGMLFRVYKSNDGRWFASLYKNDGQATHAPFISYFNRNGYVDLQTGALFDSSGNAIGSSLTLDDWLSVLNTLQVTVNKDKNGKPALFFRRSSVVETQQKQLTGDDSEATTTNKNDNKKSKKTKTSKTVIDKGIVVS